ncbi:ScbR family autoregulator-binding transcription factor [Streptomyces sp. O3]
MATEPKQERAVRTRRVIISAAAEVFDQHGYRGASMREIMKRAGVTLGAVYFHFPNKEDLARAVMCSQTETINPRLASSGLQRLVDVTLVWSHQLQADAVLRAALRLATERGGFDGQDVTSSHREWEDVMARYLEDARDQGELQGHVEPRAVAEFVVGACTGMQLQSELACARRDLPRRTVGMWRLLVPSIAVADTAKSIEVSQERAAALVA